jgi:hypothetical protein
MPYAYPTLKTGTSQDLLTIITKAYERHLEANHIELPAKSAGERRVMEPPFVLAGFMVSMLLEILPARAALRFHDKLFSGLASPNHYPFDASSPVVARAAALVRKAAVRPSLLALVSHPPVMGDMAHLNFELVRHATLGLAAVRGGPCRPRLLVAVDPFALDTIPVWQEGLYAGFMGTYHLGFDRLSLARNAVSRALIGTTAWDRLPYRFIRLLSAGREAGMVLAGGVPATTRALYATREWAARCRRESPERREPAKVIARLRALPGFAAFEKDGPHGPGLSKSAARLAESWAMATLAGVFGGGAEDCAASGRLSEVARARLVELAAAFGHAPEKARASVAELETELSRETPYRARFFTTIVARALKKRPMLILPIAHRVEGGLGVEAREAWLLSPAAGGRVSAERGDGRRFEGTLAEFAVAFGKENFK